MGQSTLGSLAQRRKALIAQRNSLQGSGERGAPQAPTREQNIPPPSPQQPESAPPAGGPGAAPADGAPSPEMTDEEAQARVEEFLGEKGRQIQGQTPVPGGERPGIEAVDNRPGPEARLQDRINNLGAGARSIETQFFRLAGREPSPRELMLFQARLTLERQLGRPPTVNEFKTYTRRTESAGPFFSAAVEQSVVNGPPPGTA